MFSFSSEILCSVFSNEGIKNYFHLSLNYLKSNFIYFGKQRGFTIKIKSWKKCCLIITLKNKVLIILIVAVCTVYSAEQ